MKLHSPPYVPTLGRTKSVLNNSARLQSIPNQSNRCAKTKNRSLPKNPHMTKASKSLSYLGYGRWKLRVFPFQTKTQMPNVRAQRTLSFANLSNLNIPIFVIFTAPKSNPKHDELLSIATQDA